MTDIEVWKTAVYDGIVYEGLYQVSNWGRIKSLNYLNTGKESVMEPDKTTNGYFQVGLWKDGESKKCLVHRLVAIAFVPNPEGKPEVNHIDENKENNRVENLEWKWHKDNCNHGTRNERIAKALSKRVLQLSLSGELIKEWESTMECERNGFDHSAVSKCCNGKIPHYKGFLWMYK